MSPQTQELGAIYAEIEREFLGDQEIEVTPVAGDPPSQYEVTYNLPSAVQDDNGEISISSGHVISISIPFGFPHFAPTCKPNSSVFHPDFDATTISLGDYWNRERSVPELIRHIAQMLIGKVYSQENAFNKEAADWYRDNSNELPFSASLQVGTVEEVSDSFKDELNNELDTIEDLDLFAEVDFDSEQHEAENKVEENVHAEEFDASNLIQLAQLNLYHQLDRKLRELDPQTQFAQKGDLEAETTISLEKAKELHAAGDDYENSGNPQKALEIYQETKATVADYPDIDNDIDRAEQATVLLSDFGGDLFNNEDEEFELDKFAFDPIPETPEIADNSTETPMVEKEQPRFFEESSKKSFNFVPFVAAGALLCVVVSLTYYYFSLTSRLTEAKQLYSECTAHFSVKDFGAAEQSCLSSLDTTSSIFLVHGQEKKELQDSIRKILNSEELSQGLMGNILHNGRYIPLSLLEAHQSFYDAMDQGDIAFSTASWDDAITKYENGINIARRTRDIPETDLINIENNLKEAKFYQLLEKAQASVQEQDWSTVDAQIEELKEALSLLDANLQPEYQKMLSMLMAKSQFEKLKLKGDTLFSEANWIDALTTFRQALEAANNLSTPEAETLDNIQKNVAKAELYSTINSGNSAFASGKWDDAIGYYGNAKTILQENEELLQLKNSQQSSDKIDRIILQSELLKIRQAADINRENNNIEDALKNLQEMSLLISSSTFSGEEEFSRLLKETIQAEATLYDELYVRNLTNYLLDNHTALFIKHYPAASPKTLENPSVTFVKMAGKEYLFRLECTEVGRGKPLKLIMFYSYDPATDKWQFSNQEES